MNFKVIIIFYLTLVFFYLIYVIQQKKYNSLGLFGYVGLCVEAVCLNKKHFEHILITKNNNLLKILTQYCLF